MKLHVPVSIQRTNHRAATPVRAIPPANPTSLVHLVSEGVVCDLYVRSFNVREQTVAYELIVSNKSDVGVSSRLYGIDTNAHTREFGMLTVPRYSAGSSFFSVPLETGERRPIYVEVYGEGVSLFAEAVQPMATRQTMRQRVALAGVWIAGVAALGATFALLRPSIEVLGTPSATAGGNVAATYAIGGSATGRYRASLADGTVLAFGALPASSGQMSFHLPAAATGHTVHLSLEAHGVLGDATRTVAFVPGTTAPASAAAQDAMAGLASIVNRGSVTTAVPAAHPKIVATSSTDAFTVPARVTAGETFDVSIPRPLPGLRIAFEDGLQAVVADVAVQSDASTVSLAAPASPSVETYHLVGTYERGDHEETFVRALRVDPR